MTLPPLFRYPIALLEQHRPLFFSKQEWWLHLLMMPVALPVGAYYFMGPRYFHDPRVLATGSLVNLAIYWLTIVLFTRAVRWAIHQFPNVQQAVSRMLVMLLSVGVIIAITAPFDVWLFSIIPGTGVRFSWEAVRPLWLLGCVLGPVFCLFIGMFYTYTQWHEHQTGNEQLKREALQHQFDALKGQLNPHFLFNSLNSLSSLIGEDPVQAERFVDGLAKVYRYMLQAGTREWVTLEAELDFLTTYTDLLQTRYGQSLRIERRIEPLSLAGCLPSLTLQLLVDNAMKHNVMFAGQPLTIHIATTETGQLRVSNSVQPKTIRVATSREGLARLVAKYRLLGGEEPQIEQNKTCFTVTVPLLCHDPA